MFKRSLITLATVALASSFGLSFVSHNTEMVNSVLQVNKKQSQFDMPITIYAFNEYLEDEVRIVRKQAESEPSDSIDTYLNVYQVEVDDYNTPYYFQYNQGIGSPTIFSMFWNGKGYYYDNLLFSENDVRKDKPITKDLKVTNESQISENVTVLMSHEEKDNLGGSVKVSFADGFAYYHENGHLFLQWLVKFQLETHATSMDVSSIISFGWALLFYTLI